MVRAVLVLAFLALLSSSIAIDPSLLPRSGGQTCALCEFVVTTVEGYASSNATEVEILNLLNEACGFLNQPYAGECQAFVQSEGTAVIRWLIDSENPEAVCQLVKLCPPELAALEMVSRFQPFNKKKAANVCPACQFVESYIQKGLSAKRDAKDIEQTLKQTVCKRMSGEFARHCELLAQQVDRVASVAEGGMSFCRRSGACSH